MRISPPNAFAPDRPDRGATNNARGDSPARGRAALQRRPFPAPAVLRKAAPPIPPPPPGGARRSWRKAVPVKLEPDATTGEARSLIAASCLAHLRGNEACLLARAHPEGAHQLRVALRRLRSILRLFADAFPARRNKFFSREGKWLLNRLSGARDWDVFLDDILLPVEDRHKNDAAFRALRAEAERARDAAYAEAAATINSRRYDRFVAALAAWAEGDAPSARRAVADAPAGKPVRAVAWQLISRRRHKIAAAGRRIGEMSEKERHRLRIRIKRLRYTVDMLESLFVRRRIEAWLKVLSDLQDTLGALNDIVLGRRLLARLTADSDPAQAKERYYAAGLVIGWHAHRVRKREKNLKKTLRKFAALPPLAKAAPKGAAGEHKSGG
jgi:CHAD domain-containing protein